MKSNTLFLFVLPYRFPTKRAYGVTTEFTARALKKLGYSVSILSSRKDSNLETEIDIELIAPAISRILMSDRIKKFIRIRYYIFVIFFTFVVKIKFNGSKKVFWCRDIFLTYILSMKSKNTLVCEIHHLPNAIQNYFLRKISKRQNTIFAPISTLIAQSLKIKESRVVISPMSIDEQEFSTSYKRFSQKKNHIVYLGQSHNGQIPTDLNFINNVACEISNTHPNWKFEVIGIDFEYFKKNVTKPLASNLQICGYLPRNRILNHLEVASIGLVIYPDTNWFRGSFPIKIVEYAATSVAIIASDTPSHRGILSESNCLFYSHGSVASLCSKIDYLIKDPEKIDFLTKNSYIWSKRLTYKNRVKKILTEINRF